MASEPDDIRKVAVITGAGGGIGRAIAAALASQGCRIIAADINIVTADETAAIIRHDGGEAMGAELDLARRESVERLFRQTLERFGRVDVLVNNAAVIGYGTVLDLPEAEWDRVIDINLKGAFLASQCAAREMCARGSGVIINITSISAELPEPDCIHYGVSKAGLASLTKTLALALAPHGVRVVAIAPGTTRTPMNAELFSDPAVVQSRLATIPLKRLATPEDIARAAAYLASDAASYVTGSTLYVEGGMMLLR